VGDLVESLMKREAGVKDSGAYFPGIGGVLDLVDSLLFNAPIMFAYLVWLTAVN
jgi:phosphatidate cytidylyltransferase